jgi:hypothetical protein
MNSSISDSDSAAAWGRCLKVFIGVAATGALLVLAFLVAVDPYDSGRFGLFGIQGIDDSTPAIANASRARDPQFDSAIVGDSTSQPLNPAELSQAAGMHFVQLAAPAVYPLGQLAVLDFFIRQHRHVGAVAIVVDAPWCTHDPRMPMANPFPFWLYENDALAYVGGSFSWHGIYHAVLRVMIALGRKKRFLPDGFASYEDYTPLTQHPVVPQQQVPVASPAFTGRIDDSFPAAALLEAEIKKLPEDAAVVLLMPPTFYTIVPSPGSRDAAEHEACKAAFKPIVAGRPRSNFIDYRIDNSLTRDPLNFLDLIHYRATIADKIQRGIAASIRFGDAAKVDF